VKIKFSIASILLASSAGALLAFSFRVPALSFFAWFAFVPFFFALQDKRPAEVFLLSYLAGLVFWFGTVYWLIHVSLIGLILLVLYISFYFVFFGFFFRLTTHQQRLSTITVPLVWIILEWIRSHLITGFGWALLGYSQYLNLSVIQIADITGALGVSFVIMAVNVALYRVVIVIVRSDPERSEGERRSNLKTGPEQTERFMVRLLRFARHDGMAVIVLVTLAFGYGFYQLHRTPYRLPLDPIKISVIQGNIPQNEKWGDEFRESILCRYESLTLDAAKAHPDLIIWPETSVPGVIGDEPELLKRVQSLAKRTGMPLLVGSVTSTSRAGNPESTSYYNSALLISGTGAVSAQYDKLHLVPFGEYVPLERYLPFLRQLIGIPIGDFKAGERCIIMRSPVTRHQAPVKFGVMICFEDVIPELSKKFVQQGADFLINITNDAWFMKTAAPYQHAAASVFRAVENRVPVVRAANTGLSCFIDINGRIYDKVNVDKNEIFVVGYSTSKILLKK